MVDTHIHSRYSHDSKQTIDEICKTAVERGIQGVTVTDHVDTWYCEEHNTYENMCNCVRDINRAREKYKGILNVFCGVELGEYLYFPERAENILRITDFDMILGSVHCIRLEDLDVLFSRVSFDKSVPNEKVLRFIKVYFAEMLMMAEQVDIDVLAHMTYPLRYINGIYGRGIDIMLFKKDIEQILKIIIEKETVLEVNTSCIDTGLGSLMPDVGVLKMYRELGGRMITIGSDAHVPHNIAKGFDKARSVLKELGFSSCCHFEKRKLCETSL